MSTLLATPQAWVTQPWALIWALVIGAAVLTVVGIVLLRNQR